MKKILLVSLMLSMLLSFASCGGNNSSSGGNDSSSGSSEGSHSSSECSHNYSAGVCSLCGAIDASYASYKAGGKDKIIRTTADGSETTLNIDISSANTRFQNMSSFATSPSMEISYTDFLEKDGWLFFSQTINLKYTVNGSAYDVTTDEVYKIKTDGTSQSAITTYRETEEKSIGVGEVFGFDAGYIYYVLENDDEGICEIYKAAVSDSLSDLTSQGTKIMGSPTAYATLCKCKLEDGYLYFTEKKVTYDTSISAAVTTMLSSYKVKLDGTGLTTL